MLTDPNEEQPPRVGHSPGPSAERPRVWSHAGRRGQGLLGPLARGDDSKVSHACPTITGFLRKGSSEHSIGTLARAAYNPAAWR
jgi:hypothetical protein